MPTYNKLVRDRIPEIIEKQGLGLNTKILNQEEYGKELKIKLQEEIDEFLAAENNQEGIEELADVLELVHALAAQLGSNMEEVEKVRAEKAEKRGGFKDKVFLIDVED